MGKQKKKIVINREESDFKPRVGRIPIGKPTQGFRDKSKYSRRQKHKKGMDHSPCPFYIMPDKIPDSVGPMKSRRLMSFAPWRTSISLNDFSE